MSMSRSQKVSSFLDKHHSPKVNNDNHQEKGVKEGGGRQSRWRGWTTGGHFEVDEDSPARILQGS